MLNQLENDMGSSLTSYDARLESTSNEDMRAFLWMFGREPAVYRTGPLSTKPLRKPLHYASKLWVTVVTMHVTTNGGACLQISQLESAWNPR